MKRNTLLSLLKQYEPTLDETVIKQQIIDFIKNYENCFERSLSIGHITASCLLLNKERTQALLMHHRKLNKWVQLGGHCDGNFDTLSVAIKEAQEESGIQNIIPLSTQIFDIDIHLIPENFREPAHYHYDIRYLLGVNSDEKSNINSESKELRWIGKTLEELPTHEKSVVRLFKKWINL